MLLSVYNKWMFSKEHFGFPAPLFVTAMHMFIQFLLAATLRYTQPRAFRPAHNPTIGDYTYVFVISDSDDVSLYVVSHVRPSFSKGKGLFQPPWPPVWILVFQTYRSRQLPYLFTVNPHFL
jgi:hypothetical protein